MEKIRDKRKIGNLKLTLLSATPKPERLVFLAARQSRYVKGINLLAQQKISQSEIKNLIEKLLDWGHFGPFEHPHFSFVLSGASRALTHQLVRHRMATYDQQSLRYVNKSQENFEITSPNDLPKGAKGEIEALKKNSLELYQKLIRQGVLAEDARFILPIGIQTSIVLTMNARSIMHFLLLRLNVSAQWEIRQCAQEMLLIMKKEMPVTFKWFEKNWRKLKPAP